MQKIAFIILAWNSDKYIRACIESIYTLKNYESQILAVDNGSDDDTPSILERLAKKCPTQCTLRVITYKRNKGTTISRNAAIKNIDTDVDYICILDSDTLINEKAVKILAQELERNPQYGIVGPRMMNSKGQIQVSGRRFPTFTEKLLKAIPLKCCQIWGERLQWLPEEHEEKSYPVDYLMSACWWIRPETIKRAGLLDEKIFYAPEDAEYCIRVWKAGYQVAFCPQAQIIHEWQRLSKQRFFSRMNWEHIKGLAYMFWKHHYFFFTANIKREFRNASDQRYRSHI